MATNKPILSLCFLLLGAWLLPSSAQPLYRNEDASIHERTLDLLGRMTVEEKIDIIRATSPGVERLGIPKYYMGNEALHGVVRPGKFTVFPQAIGLASMWNPQLHHTIATAISDEARARWNELEQGKKQTAQFSDLLTFWSPTVNMARDPRWGRTPETYGEDPYLSGVLGTAFVTGLQGDDPRYLKVVSTPKHFAANNEEHNRFECNAIIPTRDLREYYLPAFERCVKEGHAQSIMSAYNAINGVPSTVNRWLLTTVLRDEWGFDGYVVSDCGAPRAVQTNHHFVKLEETSAQLCLQAGLDLECGDDIFKEALLSAYHQDMVSPSQIDSAAYHVLRSKMRLGLFDDPDRNPYNHIDPSVVGCEEHYALALEAARQSIVLLKNEKKTLPLNRGKLRKIAVVGINAATCELGDYSGEPFHEPVTVLDGIRRRVGKKVEVFTMPWKTIDSTLPQLIGREALPNGLKAEYFNDDSLNSTPKTRIEWSLNYDPGNQAPDPFLPAAPMSARWSGELVPPVSGEYSFHFTSDDGCRMWLDDELLFEDWTSHGAKDYSASCKLEGGKSYSIRVEYFDGGGDSKALLRWVTPEPKKPLTLDDYAPGTERNIRESDVVVAVMGINKSIEREGVDRTYLGLPRDQRAFLRKVHEVNPNIVLVLVAGSSLSIDWESENIPAIVDAWYGGERGGEALSEVLFGDYNPGGRLPLTFYRSAEDLPPFDDYDMTKGRTYQYFQGDALYSFGHGLSYTSFKYSNLKAGTDGKSVTVSVDLRNTGSREGDEVVQVYVKYPAQEGRPTPLKQLRGFQRVHLEKGQKRNVSLSIPLEELRLWDDRTEEFFTPHGTYRIVVGSSSSDIREECEMTF